MQHVKSEDNLIYYKVLKEEEKKNNLYKEEEKESNLFEQKIEMIKTV